MTTSKSNQAIVVTFFFIRMKSPGSLGDTRGYVEIEVVRELRSPAARGSSLHLTCSTRSLAAVEVVVVRLSWIIIMGMPSVPLTSSSPSTFSNVTLVLTAVSSPPPSVPPTFSAVISASVKLAEPA
eukprot:1185523-Prorocentrum_minimum.AAC.1